MSHSQLITELLVFSTLNGVLYGMLLFMLASGLTLIFSLMGVLNFAHASFFMLGAYFSYQISAVTGFWLALPTAPLIVGLLGAAVERFGLRRLHRRGHVAELLFTFGLTVVIEECVHLTWGRSAVPYRVPGDLDFSLFVLWSTAFPAYRAFMLLIAVAIFLGLLLAFTRTRTGLVIQAALTHPEMVGALGHNVPGIFTSVFGCGVALAGLAGVIGGNYLVTEPGMAMQIGSILFVVVVLGGLGSLAGAFFASLLVGILQTFAVSLNFSAADLIAILGIPISRTGALADLWSLTLSRIAPTLPYLLLVLVLIFRPRGLMGTRET